MGKVVSIPKNKETLEAEIVDLVQRLCQTMNEAAKQNLVVNFQIGRADVSNPKSPFKVTQLSIARDHTS